MKTRKLMLDLDGLAVESFDTDGGVEGRRGTVKGNVCTDICSQAPTCGIIPASDTGGGTPVAHAPRTVFCASNGGGDTCDMTGCMPCCV